MARKNKYSIDGFFSAIDEAIGVESPSKANNTSDSNIDSVFSAIDEVIKPKEDINKVSSLPKPKVMDTSQFRTPKIANIDELPTHNNNPLKERRKNFKTPVQKVIDKNLENKKDTTFNKTVDSLGAGAMGILDAGTFGLREAEGKRNFGKLPQEDKLKEEHLASYWIGERIGENINPVGLYLNSIGAGSLLKTGALESGQGAIEEGIRSLVRGDNKIDVLKNTASGALGGLVGGLAVGGSGKILNKLKTRKLTKGISNKVDNIYRSVRSGNFSKPKLDIGTKTKLKTPAEEMMDLMKKSQSTEKVIPKGLKEVKNQVMDEVSTTIDNTLPLKQQKYIKNNPLNNIEKPLNTKPKLPNERGFSANVRTDLNMNDNIRKMFEEDPLMYQKISNKETLSKAQEIFNNGYDEALEDWYRNIDNFRAEDVPLARMLSNEAIQKGDVELSRKIIADTAEKLTKAGQYSQSAKILRKSDPQTFSIYLQKQINKLNEEGKNIYKKIWKDVSITDDELKTISKLDTMTEETKNEFIEGIYTRISKEIPASKLEKFNSWRRIAMLLNPKTHIRNIFGNVLMGNLKKSSDIIGNALEFTVKKLGYLKEGQVTKSIFWRQNKDLVKQVDEYWNIAKKDLLHEGRWDLDNLKFIGRDKDIFKNRFLNKLDKISKNTLNAEDTWFVKKTYKDTLGQYMSANNLKKITQEAHEYAKDKAFEATFKQANEIATFINKLKKGKGGTLVDAAVPFTKTPANLVKSSYEYSPTGFINLLFAKNNTPTQTIETISKGLTGSAVATVGFLLAKLGWSRSERQSSYKAEAMLNQFGEQPYSIITPQGSYTFDWAQPFAVPLAMGMVAYESLEKKGDVDLETLTKALTDSGDTIFNLSMLQNVKGLFGGGFGSPTEKIAGLPVSYLEQAFPTIFGQVARSVDDVRRNTYSPNKIEQFTNQIKAKTPFLSKTLEPKLNTFGQEQKQNNPITQFLSPGYYKKKSNDPVEQELMRLYKDSKDTRLLPKIAPKKLTNKGKEYILLPKELTEFQRKMGQETYNDINKIIDTPSYKRTTDENRAKKIQKIINSNYDKCKKEFLRERGIK